MALHWTGLPGDALYQGLNGGLDGQEAAQAHCGVTIPDSLRRNGDLRAMMRRGLVVPPILENVVHELYAENRIAEVACEEPLRFIFKKHRRRQFVINPGGVDKHDVGWLISRARRSEIYTQGQSVLDEQQRKSLEVINELVHCKTRLPEHSMEEIRRKLFPHVAFVRPRFEKIVIYTARGFVNPHRDSPQGDTHVGTLLMIPRMDYIGGQLVVDGRRAARNGGCYVAFPCGTEHSVLPVIEGCRLAVVFSLWAKGAADPMAVLREREDVLSEAIRGAFGLRPGSTQNGPSDAHPPGEKATAVVIRLSGLYALEQISPGALRLNSADMALYECVRKLCSPQPRVVPVQLGTYHYPGSSSHYCWISRHTHFDVGCQCAKEENEIPHPNLLDPSKVLMIGFEETGRLKPTGATPFYDAGTSLSGYKACAIAFPTAAFHRGGD